MKYFNKYAVLFAGILLAFIGVSCEKDDSSKDFGLTNVYMPQAAYATLRYNVPSGLDSVTRNYQVDTVNNKVNIILGVSRSGTQKGEDYSVQVGVREDTVAQLINTGVFSAANAMLLPSSTYTLPTSVNVSGKSASASFMLSINKASLKAYAGKTMLLCVEISKPTVYTLNTSLNKVIIVIDVNALKL